MSNVLNIRITNLIIIREKYYIIAVVYRSELKLLKAAEGFSTAWDRRVFLKMSDKKGTYVYYFRDMFSGMVTYRQHVRSIPIIKLFRDPGLDDVNCSFYINVHLRINLFPMFIGQFFIFGVIFFL